MINHHRSCRVMTALFLLLICIHQTFHSYISNIYLVDFTSSEANLATCLFTKSSQGWLWHRMPAHIRMNQLKKAFKSDLVRGVKDVIFEKDKLCGACQTGKQVANPHPYNNFMST